MSKDVINFFVCARNLPTWIATFTLAAQAIDSNALLGVVDLSYKYSFYDGAVVPIGLGMSLILNGIFLGHHINKEMVLTLPDVLARRYGRTVEVLASLASVTSFIMLVAGNLVGFASTCSYVWQISNPSAVWIAASAVWFYTACGGLHSVASTDVAQGLVGWSGCLAVAYWMLATENVKAPPPSIGFPGMKYEESCLRVSAEKSRNSLFLFWFTLRC
jgi:Na+/proline symporter